MKRGMLVAALVVLASPLALLSAGGKGAVSGEYVEARTAEVFTGGCIMGSEAETVGKNAVLAWKVNQGSFNGVSLDGLTVVAAVAGDKNLGIGEIGGGKATTKSAVFVDSRANAAQQMALVAMATELSNGLVGNIVQVTPSAIEFADRGKDIHVAAAQVALDVSKEMSHDPTCGAMQWFHPLATVDQATIGVAQQNAFSGSGLGAKWSDPNRRSAFFGTFAY
jgi:uncharacterized protein DUF1326